MKTIAIVTAFPPSAGSLNEYGLHLVNAFAARSDIKKIIVIADKYKGATPELDLGPKVEVKRVWRFNDPLAGIHILRALKSTQVEGALYNLQTASFGDREIPAALGLLTPMISQKTGLPSGVIMHNLVEAVDLSKTNLAKSPFRQKLVGAASYFVTKTMLMSGFMTVTLDSFWDILKEKYKAKNAFMVPHGSFPLASDVQIPALAYRPNIIVTMGKFGTYKRLERTIAAIQKLNMSRAENKKVKLVIGGSDHPATPGYLKSLENEHKADANIVFHGYVAEEDVATFFTQAKLAVFDYDSTTGSSGVLHQAAIYGTPAAYPMMGDFIDVTEREGLKGFNFIPLDQVALENSITECLDNSTLGQSFADNNIHVSKGVTMETVASIQLQLLKKTKSGNFNVLRRAKNSALHLKEIEAPRPTLRLN
jgi:glycosyltransferase involved in cell wall biosynthesis